MGNRVSGFVVAFWEGDGCPEINVLRGEVRIPLNMKLGHELSLFAPRIDGGSSGVSETLILAVSPFFYL